MRYIFTLLFIGLLSLSVQSQTAVEITTGAGYANEVFYNLEDGTQDAHPRNEWDLAFATNRYSVNIIANNGTEVQVYTYPNGTIDDWDNVDASGIASWPQMYNSIESWDGGAFVQNVDPNNMSDFGWGLYDMVTHHIKGDSIFIIKTVDGNMKKFAVIDRDPNMNVNSWEIKFANIDGSDEHTEIIAADSYVEKNFIYYSLDNKEILDREPASEDWDLLFTKYYDYTIPYFVSGVLSNDARVTVEEVDGVDQATFEELQENNFVSNISTIGSDWKEFDMTNFVYIIDNDRVFFVKEISNDGADSTYWKIYFNGFSGMSTGVYSFMQEKLDPFLSINDHQEQVFVEVYPNPVVNTLQVVADFSKIDELAIYDINGRLLKNEKIDYATFSKHRMQVEDLNRGIYFLTLKSGSNTFTKKFVKY